MTQVEKMKGSNAPDAAVEALVDDLVEEVLIVCLRITRHLSVVLSTQFPLNRSLSISQILNSD